jgi:hypothetical protein
MIQKLITDYTGVLIFRLPLMQGGAYWLASIIMSQASVFVCVNLYLEHAEAPGGGGEKIDSGLLWAGTAGLAAAWLATFIYFVFGVTVPRLRHSLWSWTSGRQVIQQQFLEGESDEVKFFVFKRNVLLWEGDIGDEVRGRTAENWTKWKAEKPPWFNIELVPEAYIPAGELEGMGGRKRRGSALRSVRESFREGAAGAAQ